MQSATRGGGGQKAREKNGEDQRLSSHCREKEACRSGHGHLGEGVEGCHVRRR
ncbi:hypothetical protein MUK42_07855 [Musa troglodytarum]|uniref:Uncharacterized protein n=1 Tax=Musa troglodytarum TaxID=320322 RepID=A0A9E7L4H3_9LILI|nr:hypothetical protein MUK42_07855 [Musa troglodytarum]